MQKLLFYFTVVLIASCSVPKVMNESGRVTPKGHVTGGATYMGNFSGVGTSNITSVLVNSMKGYNNNGDSAYYSGLIKDVNKAMMAYSLDPLTVGSQFYLRVGIANRMELGYLRAKKTNMFQYNFQFLGFDKDQKLRDSKRWFGSAGIRYSWNKFTLPNYFSHVQQVLGYSYSRRDWLVPLTFSYSFGPEECYGSVSFGAIYGHHHLSYSFVPNDLFNSNGLQVQGVSQTKNYSSFGFFCNLKAGYRFIYVIPSIAIFYQKYGTYLMLDQSQVGFSGWTLVPGISLQLNTVSMKKKKKS
ncbi:MAG: hypothetical protein GC180_11530 [Bacteroidetes bacterium]|nr:hypothetical protein [Bacteroidota bacterium]